MQGTLGNPLGKTLLEVELLVGYRYPRAVVALQLKSHDQL